MQLLFQELRGVVAFGDGSCRLRQWALKLQEALFR